MMKRSVSYCVSLALMGCALVWPSAEASKVDSALIPLYTTQQQVTTSEYYHLHAASALMSDKRFDPAVHHLQQAREQSPTNILVLFNLGFCHLEMAKQETDPQRRTQLVRQAEEAFIRVRSINPTLVFTYFKLGKAALMEKRFDDAERYYIQGLKADPTNAGLLFNLAGIYDQRQDFPKAIEYYQAAITADPDFVFAYNNLGLVMEQQGRLSEAEAAYKKAIKGDPDYHFAILNLGNLYAEQNRLQEALKLYNKVLMVNPENSWAHLYLGNIYLRQGRYEQAALAYQDSVALNPDYPLAYYLLAKTLERLHRVDEALSASLTYIRLMPTGDHVSEMNALISTLRMKKAASLQLLPGGSLISPPARGAEK